uniref:Uncharacterized protein n=1 Tax=Picea sitchensis TaxID=3332 RepID=A0A6B9XUT1_PICSI|nr:hypothetical protein Q903MT_gene4028 [Picea sitchensis]
MVSRCMLSSLGELFSINGRVGPASFCSKLRKVCPQVEHLKELLPAGWVPQSIGSPTKKRQSGGRVG